MIKVYVFGSTKAGKTSFLTGEIKKTYSETKKPLISITKVEEGKTYQVVFIELPSTTVASILDEKDKTLDQCDIACMTYDGNDKYSFSYLVEVQKKIYSRKLPCLYVQTKNDLRVAQVSTS